MHARAVELVARRALLRLPLYLLARESDVPEPRLKLIERSFLQPTEEEWHKIVAALERMELARGYRWREVAQCSR